MEILSSNVSGGGGGSAIDEPVPFFLGRREVKRDLRLFMLLFKCVMCMKPENVSHFLKIKVQMFVRDSKLSL